MFISMNQAVKFRPTLAVISAIAASILLMAPPAASQDTSHSAGPIVLVDPSKSSNKSVEILTPTQGVDFTYYLSKLTKEVRAKWTSAMPAAALSGEKGVTRVVFQVQSNGKIEYISLDKSSGTDSLDQAALAAVRESAPLDPLPLAFKGPFVVLRFIFIYNLPPDTALDSSEPDCGISSNTRVSTPPFDRLELLAFASVNLDVPYAKKIICERGIDFNPDPTALQVFRNNNVTLGLVETVSKLKPRPASNPATDRDRAFVTFQLALGDMRGGQPAAADVDYKRSLQLAEESPSLHSAYAAYLNSMHRPVEAEAQARRSLELWPDNANAHVVLAVALSLQNREADAVSEAQEALRLFPDHSGALVDLGFALARSGQYTRAIPILHTSTVRVPNMALIHKYLGGCLVHTRDFPAAIEELNVFLKKTPNDAEAQYDLGVALRETDNKEGAQAHFHEASRLAPDNPIYSTAATPADSISATSVSTTSPGPRPDDGVVSGNIYTNNFFGFSYQFPKGWMVLDARNSQFMQRFGGSIMANGDPILLDVSEAAARNTYPLLLVAKETTKEIRTTFTVIHIQALDRKFAPDAKSGEEFARSMADVLRARGLPLSVNGTAEKFSIDGEQFWKVKMDLSMNGAVAHVIQVVMIEKKYLLLFVFASPDASKLDDLVGTMQSLRFTKPQQ